MKTKMEVINLSNEWLATIRDSTDMDVNNLDVSEWETMSLPLDEDTINRLALPNRIWLQREFMMPINEECSTWWLELNIGLCGRVWLNGKLVDNLDDDDIYQVEVTNYTALDENVLVLCLEPTPAMVHWLSLECVPYPCGD